MLPSIITPREKDVLLRLTHGKPNKHIARELGISPNTVRDHVTCLLKKFNATNRLELGILALRARALDE